MTEIDLATQKQLVLDLKAKLQKVKDAAWVAREASKAVENAAYKRRVVDTEARLVEEVVGVCRDYCIKVWAEALTRAGIPVDSKLRGAGSIFFPEAI